MIRRFGEPPRRDVKYTMRPGAYAVLMREGRMLITYQAAPDDEFQLPGGGIDPGEPPVLALHREVYEETGCTITRPTRLGAFRRFVYMPEYEIWAEKLCTIYSARPVSCIGPPTESGHSAHWMWPEQAIPLLANSGDRFFAQSVLS